jgi:hypothetical protein
MVDGIARYWRGLHEYLCCFLLWLIRHFVMDQNQLTEYSGLCVAFAMRAIVEFGIRDLLISADMLGLELSTPINKLTPTTGNPYLHQSASQTTELRTWQRWQTRPHP